PRQVVYEIGCAIDRIDDPGGSACQLAYLLLVGLFHDEVMVRKAAPQRLLNRALAGEIGIGHKIETILFARVDLTPRATQAVPGNWGSLIRSLEQSCKVEETHVLDSIGLGIRSRLGVRGQQTELPGLRPPKADSPTHEDHDCRVAGDESPGPAGD